MSVSEYTPNVQLSEFALKLRRFRYNNRLAPQEVAAMLRIDSRRYGDLEFGRAVPTLIEKWRFSRLLAKQKTASTK